MQGDSIFDNISQENAVSYELYTHAEPSGEQLHDLQLQCMAIVLPYLTNYIWQQDPFTLHSSTVSKSPWSSANARRQHNRHADQSLPEHLWGFTRFGDNIEDEWFIFWLLNQITTKFNTVSARIWDNDGEFLLIEAAYSLPKWLKPDTSTNRIWLHSGCLHVIPLPNKHHWTLPAAPTVLQALQILASDSISTKANSGMQEAISSRVKGYPRKAQAEMHRARCTLPAKVAHIVQKKPQLVAPAAHTFHYRDLQDMKAAAKLAVFPPQDLVTTIVMFNRALYAQLAQQQFQPPKGYPMPPSNSPALRAAELGMKLTCGFEMVMAKGSSGSVPTPQGTQGGPAVQDHPRWPGYLASLTRNGYFKDSIQGSAQYKELLTEAAQAFMEAQPEQQSAGAGPTPAQSITAILEQPARPELYKDGPEDDDAWMTGGAAELEAELQQRQAELGDDVAKHAKRTAQGLGDPEAAPEFDPSQMASKMQAFMNQVSGHEGAEVPDGLPEDVTFDNPAFWRELKAALGVAADKHGLDMDLDSDSASSSSDGFSDTDSQYSESAASPSPNSRNGGPSQAGQAEATSSRHKAYVQMNPGPSASSSQQHPTAPPVTSVHTGPMPYNTDGEAQGDDGSGSDVLTATDSDDEEAGFMHAYDKALAEELSGSRVGSILHPAAAEGGHQGIRTEGDEVGGNGVQPVDLDTNLVRSLLQSYTAQQGLAGPAGNLAGLLGLNLPDNANTD